MATAPRWTPGRCTPSRTTSSWSLARIRRDTQAVASICTRVPPGSMRHGSPSTAWARQSRGRSYRAFNCSESSVLGGLRVRPVRFVVLGGAVSYEDYTTTPSDPARTPGPGDDETFVHSTASAGFDWRPADGYARRGGLYEVRVPQLRGPQSTRSTSTASTPRSCSIFRSCARTGSCRCAEPCRRRSMAASFRSSCFRRSAAAARCADTAAGGSAIATASSSPRSGAGFQPGSPSIWRIFYDTGKVASERRDLNFDGLKSDVGIGVRFHGPAATPLRIELAHGSEGFHMIFSGGPAF